MDVIIPGVIGIAAFAGAIVIFPAAKFAIDMSPYLYSNTRCSARLGLLIRKNEIEELLASASMNEFFASLENSYYSSIVEHSRNFSTFSTLLEKDLYNTYRWVESFTPKAIKPIINAIKLKFEINNIKRTLNSIKNSEPVSNLDFIQDHEFKLKLEDSKEYQNILAAVEGTVYEAVFANKKIKDIRDINSSLDRFYSTNVLKAIDRSPDSKAAEPFLEFWKSMIDLFNTRIVMRRVRDDVDENLLEGGHLDTHELTGISDMTQFESVLGSSRYAESGDLNTSPETVFYNYFRQLAGNIGAKFTIKSGAIVKFLMLKELETRNLNILVKLKSENIKQEEIRNLLVI